MKQIRVVLIEDHFLARMALQSVLADHAQIRIVAEASDGEQGINLYRSLQPDVVVLDLRLPHTSGFEVITQLRKEPRPGHIVVLSNYSGGEDVYRAVRGGAIGYLTKDASGEEVIDAILHADLNIRFLPRNVRDSLVEHMPSMELTPRERQVLVCITHGRSNREIAEELHIAEKTVRMHVSSVLEKMGARDRTQAAIYAIQSGLVHLD
jgi:DNA-binding NarL/FixJ family response regulator